jgi:hypothetical protein
MLRIDRHAYVAHLEDQVEGLAATQAAVRSHTCDLEHVKTRLKELTETTVNIANTFKSHQAVIQESKEAMQARLQQVSTSLERLISVPYYKHEKVCISLLPKCVLALPTLSVIGRLTLNSHADT